MGRLLSRVEHLMPNDDKLVYRTSVVLKYVVVLEWTSNMVVTLYSNHNLTLHTMQYVSVFLVGAFK